MEEETIDLSFRKRSKKGKKERRFNNDPFYFFESIEEGTTFIADEGIARPFSSSFFGIDLSTRDALSFSRFDIFDTIGLWWDRRSQRVYTNSSARNDESRAMKTFSLDVGKYCGDLWTRWTSYLYKVPSSLENETSIGFDLVIDEWVKECIRCTRYFISKIDQDESHDL